jgi:hypothetical protein
MWPHQSTLRMIKSLVCTRSGLAPERCAWELKRGQRVKHQHEHRRPNTSDRNRERETHPEKNYQRVTRSDREPAPQEPTRALAADEREPVACQGKITSAGQLLLRDLRKSNTGRKSKSRCKENQRSGTTAQNYS